MRLWHYKLIPYLPKAMLVSQWRECIAIKRQWEKGTLKHRLVSYVMDYDKALFYEYTLKVFDEMKSRNIKFKYKYIDEIFEFCFPKGYKIMFVSIYKEHNEKYLKQCLYNLQEKADREIINKEEWKIIEDNFKKYLGDDK